MDYIDIKGYKSIRDARIDIKPINILIGGNGSGKSNLLSFFEFLKQIYKQNLREHVVFKGIDTVLHNGSEVTDKISAHLSFANDNGYSFTLNNKDGALIFRKEEICSGSSSMNIASIGYESNLRFQTEKSANFIKEYLDQIAIYNFNNTGKMSPFYKESNIENDKYYLYERGENLAAFLYNIKNEDPIIYNRIVKIIQMVASYFSDFVFNPTKGGNISLQWKNKHSNTIYGAKDLSDGTIRFIALTTLLMQPELPDTIIIDEPDLGLQPLAVAMLAGMISSASARGAKLIIATQSQDLAGEFKPDDIISVKLKDSESVFKRLSSEELYLWLDNITMINKLKRNLIHNEHS